MINGLMLKISYLREHVERIQKMLDWEIFKILNLKVDNDKPLLKPTSEDEETDKFEKMEEKIES